MQIHGDKHFLSSSSFPNTTTSYRFLCKIINIELPTSFSLIYHFIYILPTSPIDHIIDPILIQNSFCSTTSRSTSTEDYDIPFVTKFIDLIR